MMRDDLIDQMKELERMLECMARDAQTVMDLMKATKSLTKNVTTEKPDE